MTTIGTRIDLDPTTQWIVTTMTPDVAAWALVLTPGARFSVAPENLIGKDVEFAELRYLVEEWDKAVWMLRRYEAIPAHKMTETFMQLWAAQIDKVYGLVTAIDEMITEFGA